MLVRQALLGATACSTVEIWFQDKARVGQKGGHSYVWAEVGSRPPMVRDVRHDSAYLFGAICPGRGVGAAIIMPSANTEAMNEHLKGLTQHRCRGPQSSGVLLGRVPAGQPRETLSTSHMGCHGYFETPA